MPEYKLLFEPFEFAGLKMKNHVLMPAMHIGMAADGFVEISGGSIPDGQRVVVAE